MTTEQLKELGLSEDQIKEVFKLNGIAVENAKKDVEKIKEDLGLKNSEIETLKNKLEAANTQIEGFADIDVEDMQKTIEQYKIDMAKLDTDYQKQLNDVRFEHQLEKQLQSYNPYDVNDIKVYIDKDALQVTDRSADIIGLHEQIEALKETKGYLFKQEKPPEDTKFTGVEPIDPVNKGDATPKGQLTYEQLLQLHEKGVK